MLRILWNTLRQLGHLAGEILVFILALGGLCLMVKYLGKAMILGLPLLVLFVGLALLSYSRMRKRAQDRRAAKERQARR